MFLLLKISSVVLAYVSWSEMYLRHRVFIALATCNAGHDKGQHVTAGTAGHSNSAVRSSPLPSSDHFQPPHP